MAREVYSYQVTIPAGTSPAVPFTGNTPTPTRTLTELEIVVPPGPAGLMGFAITMGGVNVLPVTPGTWVITDDERITWSLEGQPNSGAWQLTGYNTGVFDHTVYLRFLADLIDEGDQSSLLDTIPMSDLSSP